MIVRITGNCETAARARHMVVDGGGAVVHSLPRFSFDVIEDESIVCPEVDGVDSPFEARFVTLLAELCPSGRVTLRRGGGNRSDKHLVLYVPGTDQDRAAAATAIYRTVLQLTPRGRWWRRLLWILAALVLSTEALSAQIVGGTVNQGKPGTLPWLVNATCSISGGASGSGSALLAGVVGVTVAAGALATGAIVQVLVQSDPANTVNVLVGNASAQPLVLQPGDAATFNLTNLNLLYVKSASATANVNYVAR